MFKIEGFRKRKVATVNTVFYQINSKKSWFYWFENEDGSLVSRKHLILFPKLANSIDLYLSFGAYIYSKRKNKFARRILKKLELEGE